MNQIIKHAILNVTVSVLGHLARYRLTGKVYIPAYYANESDFAKVMSFKKKHPDLFDEKTHMAVVHPFSGYSGPNGKLQRVTLRWDRVPNNAMAPANLAARLIVKAWKATLGPRVMPEITPAYRELVSSTSASFKVTAEKAKKMYPSMAEKRESID